MDRILESVGRGGRNRGKDVLVVRKLLNKNLGKLTPLAPLEESEKSDAKLEFAIQEFQRRQLGDATPDGRVDPEGKTLRALRGEAVAKPGFVQLQKTGHGWYTYTTADKLWGTDAAIASIKKLAESVFSAYSIEIAVGDISFQKGGKMPPHGSHRKGLDVDLRPLRGDEKHLPVTIDSDDYSRERTAKMVELLKKDENLRTILFNDKEIEGVTWWKGHHNHLHVRFRR